MCPREEEASSKAHALSINDDTHVINSRLSFALKGPSV